MFYLCQYIKNNIETLFSWYIHYSCYTIIATLLLLYDIVYHQLINYGKAKTVTVQEWVLSWVIHTHRPHPFVYLCSVFLITTKYVYAAVNFLCLVGFLYNWVQLIGKSLIIIVLWYFFKQSTFSSSFLNPSY